MHTSLWAHQALDTAYYTKHSNISTPSLISTCFLTVGIQAHPVYIQHFTSSTLLVIQALVALVHDPEPEHPLRGDLAEEYTKDRKTFDKKAEEFTVKFAEKRPAD